MSWKNIGPETNVSSKRPSHHSSDLRCTGLIGNRLASWGPRQPTQYRPVAIGRNRPRLCKNVLSTEH